MTCPKTSSGPPGAQYPVGRRGVPRCGGQVPLLGTIHAQGPDNEVLFSQCQSTGQLCVRSAVRMAAVAEDNVEVFDGNPLSTCKVCKK